MSSSVLPTRVAIECIDEALVLGKRHFWPLFRVGLIPFLAYAGIAYFFTGRATPLALRVPAIVVAYGFYALMEAVTIVGAWDLLHGRPLDIGTAWRAVRQHVFSILLAYWLRIAVIYVGLIFLIFPGIYFVAIYFAVPTVNVIEGLGVRASLTRSRSLALGSIPGILVSVGAFWFVAVAVAWLIPRALSHVGVPPGSVVRPVCSWSWAALVGPFRSAVTARIYLAIRVRKEGYDLQRMVSSLPSAA